MDFPDKSAVIAVVAFLLGLLVGIIAAEDMVQPLRQQAIARGYAQHNPTTGVWEWVEPENLERITPTQAE